MKKIGNGLGFKIVQAVLYTLAAIVLVLAGPLFAVRSAILLALGVVIAVIDILHLIATFKGRKSKGANVLGIVVNLPFALCSLGLCGLIGCIKGRMYLQFKEAGYLAGESVRAKSAAATQSVRAKPAAAIQSVRAKPAAATQSARAKPAAATQSSVQADNRSSATKSDQLRTKQPASERQQVKKCDFKLELYDASIDEKTWKQFKRTASQDELAVIAIGAKYRVAHSRIKNILFAIGIVLSIVLFLPTGGYSLIGYAVFAFLSTKAIRYEDTLSQAYNKLDKKNKAFVDSYFNCGIGWTILDIIIKFGVFWLTIPYQAILLFIGLFAPNFVISKNGILVSIPNGYDVGNLGAVGAYYSSFSFIDEALSNQSKTEQPAQSGSAADDYYKRDEYTYTDSHGYEQSVYSSDGKDFYDVGGHYVGSSDEYGGNFKLKD